jgi:hypothetical protein
MLSAILIFTLQPTGYLVFIAPLAAMGVLTVIGVFLVPVSERLRSLLVARHRRRRRGAEKRKTR